MKYQLSLINCQVRLRNSAKVNWLPKSLPSPITTSTVHLPRFEDALQSSDVIRRQLEHGLGGAERQRLDQCRRVLDVDSAEQLGGAGEAEH